MCSYLSKQENEFSETMKQAMRKALDSRAGRYGQTKSITYAYVSRRECSLQEVVYHLMLELCLRKVFPGVLYAML